MLVLVVISRIVSGGVGQRESGWARFAQMRLVVAGYHTHSAKYLEHYGVGSAGALALGRSAQAPTPGELNLCTSTADACGAHQRPDFSTALWQRGG